MGDSADVIEIPIGTDRMQAQFLADECRGQGLDVEVVIFDETRAEMGSAGAIDNRLLVKAEDEAAARQIIADLHPDASDSA